MIRRTLDPAGFNRVCAHPEVSKWLEGGEPWDVTPLVSNPQNIALWTGEGGFILVAGPAASFEVHTQFTPEGRQHSFAAMKAGLDYMFTRTGCLQITTFLPDNNPAARGLATKGGFVEWFRRTHPTMGEGAQARIDIDQWICGEPELEKDGERFHEAVEAAVKSARPDLPDHPEDKIHDRYVGACVRMASRGHTRKAEAIYGRWAVNAGYTPARIISDAPPTFDVSEQGLNCIVALHDGEIQVLSCQ
jgi:hypothetical protein